MRQEIKLTPDDVPLLEAYSTGKMDAITLRTRLDGATFGEVLMLLREAGLPLPKAPVEGREVDIARARQWLFPEHGA